MTIQITCEDIEQQSLCPVAVALRRHIRQPFAVGEQYLMIGRQRRLKWTAKVVEFIKRSDRDMAVGPMEFKIAL